MFSLSKFSLTKVVSMFVIVAVLLGSVIHEAEARRMGGGKSFGGNKSGQMYKSNSSNKPSQAANTSTKGSAAKGILGGLAAGLGLAWLASSLGLGEGFGNIILIVIIFLIVMTVIRRFGARAMAAQANAAGIHQQQHTEQLNQTQQVYASGSTNYTDVYQDFIVPAEIDQKEFEQIGENNFIELQKAWEKGDLIYMRAMMTDDMFSLMRDELQNMQQNRESRKAKVEHVEAKLLGIKPMSGFDIAAIKFSGLMQEDDVQARPFAEVWTLVKDVNASGWLLDGISQVTH